MRGVGVELVDDDIDVSRPLSLTPLATRKQLMKITNRKRS